MSRTSGRPDARITKSRSALHSALLELVAEMPFEDVTIAALAARAGVGYATFFRHYPTREALLAEIADGLIGELLALIRPLLMAGDPGAAALALTLFVDERRSLARALLVGAGDALRRDITGRAVAISKAADQAMPPWLPHDLGVVHIAAATLTILGWWLDRGADHSAATMADILNRLVFSPTAQPDDSASD